MLAIEMDFAMGSAIADDIIPSALKYFTGQAQIEDENINGEYVSSAGHKQDDDEVDDNDADVHHDAEDDDNKSDGEGELDGASPPLHSKPEGECKQQ